MKDGKYKRWESPPDEYRTWLPPEDSIAPGAPDKEVITPLPKEDPKLPNPDTRRDEFNFEREVRDESVLTDTQEQIKQKKRHKRKRRMFYAAFSAAFVFVGTLNTESGLFGYLDMPSSSWDEPYWDEPYEDEPEEPWNGVIETQPRPDTEFVYHPDYGPYDAQGTISVFDGTFDMESGSYGENRLSFTLFSEGSFTGMDLPEASEVDGFTNIGYILICDGIDPDPATYEVKRPTSTWMLKGNMLSVEDLQHVSFAIRSGVQIHMVRFDPNRQAMEMVVGMHANGGSFDASEYPLFPDITPDYCEVSACSALYSDGWAYLDAYPVPTREGYTFTGWYDSEEAAAADLFSEEATQGRLCVIHPHEFYQEDPDSLEGVDWSKPITRHVYAGWQED